MTDLHRFAGHLQAFVADMRRFGVERAGKFDVRRYETWRRQRAGAAHRFPHAWAVLSDATKAAALIHRTGPRAQCRDSGGGIADSGAGLSPDERWLALTGAGLGTMSSGSLQVAYRPAWASPTRCGTGTISMRPTQPTQPGRPAISASA